jgi:N-methylhydantoinase A
MTSETTDHASSGTSSPTITRIGVDIGGTFTDLIFYDGESGRVRLAKEPTTPDAPQHGVVNATREGVPPTGLASADYFLHGTTVGLNALLEHRGSSVALLTTKGFRDTLEIRRGDAVEPYNLFWHQPQPLVERSLRLPITERMRADGAVHVPLLADDVRHAAATLIERDIGSAAVVYVNAYAHPQHELETERLLREYGYTGLISLSHRVSGEFREYERTCTTVIDAYVRPRTATYLKHLDRDLRDTGFVGSLLVTRSGGGAMTVAEAEGRPFETIMSGPVAGAEGAAELSRTLGLSSTITADVGGTSFDTCLITNGRSQITYQGEVIGLPVQSPWVDVRSIGAGGGSIARVDAGGLLRVGPESAGAAPGPACYGHGGIQPTVTDAACWLGMLGPGELASGITLDRDAAHGALKPLAHQLSMTDDDVAKGIMTIASASMADAIRGITVEQGQDPREASLMAFGGAGPLFATLLARDLDIGNIVIPMFAGNFSAWGLLGADLVQTGARTQILPLTDASISVANQMLDGLFEELRGRMGDAPGDRIPEIGLDMRYTGQEHSLTVGLDCTNGRIAAEKATEIRAAFVESYRRTFGHEMAEEAEIVAARATLRTPLPRIGRSGVDAARADPGGQPRQVSSYSFVRGRWADFDLIDRSILRVGIAVRGPTIVLEDTTTTYLDDGFVASVDPSGSLVIKGAPRE